MPQPTSWRGWRNWAVSSPNFQRWVWRLPLLRSLSRPHAKKLFGICSGFIHSQALFASARLGLLEALRAGPVTTLELQHRCGLTADGLRRLLDCTEALGLTESRRHGQHGLGLLGAALLGNPAVLQMIQHQPLFYGDLADPIGLLRGCRGPGQLELYWGYARRQKPAELEDDAVAGYTQLMAATQSLVADDVIAAYDFASHRQLLDVGGGDGTFLRELALRLPRLQLGLFDLPAVAARARLALAAAGLGERVQAAGGDFLVQPLPQGADVISLVRILHDHDDQVAAALLRNVRGALPAGGKVVIAEPMRGLAGSIRDAEIYLDFYLLAMGQGRVRAYPEMAALLAGAGFGSARLHRTRRPWQCGVVSAVAA
jgi:demethylspheroidene O-methyltransferase